MTETGASLSVLAAGSPGLRSDAGWRLPSGPAKPQ